MYVFPKPLKLEIYNHKFLFSKKVYLHISKKFAGEAFKKLYGELWNNFTAGFSNLEFVIDEKYARTAILSLSVYPEAENTNIGEYEYEICCNTHSVNLHFHDEVGLAHAMATILQMISINDISKEEFFIPCCDISDKPEIKFRGIHICVFPESSLEFIKKTVRLCGLMKYSHIVLEFWGTLKYDCLDSLGWKELAYDKKQIAPLIDEGKAMGMEFIPMFNHLGHAAQCRSCSGKHTILDQNPKLEPLFEPDGWTWCLSNPDTLKLLKNIRGELMDLFGEGSYFHLGCDEAYTFATCGLCSKKDKGRLIADYINELAAELLAEGRKPIIWADMTLGYQRFPLPYITTPDAGFDPQKFLKSLNDNIILDDWQYDVEKGEYLTGKYLMENHSAQNIIVSPWRTKEPIEYLCRKVKEMHLGGVLETTWNTLAKDYVSVMMTAIHCWQNTFADYDKWEFYSCHLAKLLRKLNPSNGIYEDSGFLPGQLDI